MTPRTVSIVVPNYNGEALLATMLPRLVDAIGREPVAEIIVADANSSDGSVGMVRSRWPVVLVVESETPLGFAANCNRGAARASGEIVLFLNTDVAVEDGFLGPLLEPFADADVFAVGPRILRPTPGRVAPINESLHRTFFSFGLFYSSGLHDRADPPEPVEIAYACGAAIAVRRTMFDALGGFDTLYDPFYWEDLDLCYRAWARGWRVLYQPASAVRHEHRATIARYYEPDHIDTILERNRWLFAWKNLHDPILAAAHVVFLPVKLVEGALGRRWAVIRGLRLAWARRRDAFGARRRERALRTRSDRQVLQIFRESARRFGRPQEAPSLGPR